MRAVSSDVPSCAGSPGTSAGQALQDQAHGSAAIRAPRPASGDYGSHRANPACLTKQMSDPADKAEGPAQRASLSVYLNVRIVLVGDTGIEPVTSSV